MENTNINIPVTTVDSFVETMTRLYAKAINAGVSLRMIPAPFLWGAPGVGKSQGVRQIGEKIESVTGKSVHITDVRLLLLLRLTAISSFFGANMKIYLFDKEKGEFSGHYYPGE